MRRKSNQQHQHDRQCSSQLQSGSSQLYPSFSEIEQNSKNHKNTRSISNVELEKEIPSGCCTTAEDIQSLQQKMRDQFKKSLQTRSSTRDLDTIQNLQISVLLTSNSDLNLRESPKSLLDTPKGNLIETPKNFEKPKDILQMQEQMESKKYYMMSCIKPKNQQNILSSRSGTKTEDILNEQQQSKYQSLNQSYQKCLLKSSHSSFDESNKSYVSCQSLNENEKKKSYHGLNNDEVGIKASPKKRRIDDSQYKYCQQESMNDSQMYNKIDDSQIYDNYEDIKMFDINNQNYKENKDNNQMQNRNNNNPQNNQCNFNYIYKNSNQRQNKFNNPQSMDSYLNVFNKQFGCQDYNQIQQQAQNCHNIYRQSTEQMESEQKRNSLIKLNDIVEEMKNNFEYENQHMNTQHTGRSASERSSIHEIWDDTPLHERGIDTENWVDLKNNGELKKFTLFHLYKARYGQFNGEPISNDAVVDIMKRFVRNQRVQNVSNYPWYSFDDNLNYVDIKEDQEKDPLCKRFTKYPEEIQSRKRRGGVQNINQQQLNALQQNNINTEQKLINFDKSDIKLEKEQSKREFDDSQIDITKMHPIQLNTNDNLKQNIPYNQQDSSQNKQLDQNKMLKETYGQVDLENIHAITQESDEYCDINYSTTQKDKQYFSGNNSPEFAQSFNPNFTLGSKQKPEIRENIQTNHDQQDYSYRGMIYNNLVKCEASDASLSANINNNQKYYHNDLYVFNGEIEYQNDLNNIKSSIQNNNRERNNKNEYYYEQSPNNYNIKNTYQSHKKQNTQKSIYTPLRKNKENFQNQTTKSTEKNSSNFKTVKKNEVKFSNKKQNEVTEKRKNKVDQRKSNSLSQQKKQLNYNRSSSYHQDSPLQKRQKNFSPNCSPNKNTNISSSYNQHSCKQSKGINGSIKKSSQAKNTYNQNNNYQQDYYRFNNNLNNSSIKKQSNNLNENSNAKKQLNKKSISDKLYTNKNRDSSKQQTTVKKDPFRNNLDSKNNSYCKTNISPTKTEKDNSFSITRKDFSQYFQKDYAKYYNKRKYVSNSCEKTIKVQTSNQSSTKKNQSKLYSPNKSYEKKQKRDNSLKNTLRNSGIDENGRLRIQSDYVQQYNQSNCQPDDNIINYYNIPNNNLKTSDFNVEEYLNANYNPYNKNIINRNYEEIFSQSQNNYSVNPNIKSYNKLNNNNGVKNNTTKSNKIDNTNIINNNIMINNSTKISYNSMLNNSELSSNKDSINGNSDNNELINVINNNNNNFKVQNNTYTKQSYVSDRKSNTNNQILNNHYNKPNYNINHNQMNSHSVNKQSNKQQQHIIQFSKQQQQLQQQLSQQQYLSQQQSQIDQESNYFSFNNNSNLIYEKPINVKEQYRQNQIEVPYVNNNYIALNGFNGNHQSKLSVYKQLKKQQIYKQNEYQQQSQYH